MSNRHPPFGDIAKAHYDTHGDFTGTFEMHVDTVSEPSPPLSGVVRVMIRYKYKPVAGVQVNCLKYGGSTPEYGWDSRVFEFSPSGDGWEVLKMHGYKSAQAELPVPAETDVIGLSNTMETKVEAADPTSIAGGATTEGALASLLAEHTRLRAVRVAAQAEHSARQDAVDALLADVTTMGTKSPEEQEALVARIAASMTSSAGAEAEEEEEEEEEKTSTATTENEAASRPSETSSERDGHLRRIRELAEVAEVRAAKVEKLAEFRYEEAKAHSEKVAKEAMDVAEHAADEARATAEETFAAAQAQARKADEEKEAEAMAVVALEKKRDDSRCVLVATH